MFSCEAYRNRIYLGRTTEWSRQQCYALLSLQFPPIYRTSAGDSAMPRRGALEKLIVTQPHSSVSYIRQVRACTRSACLRAKRKWSACDLLTHWVPDVSEVPYNYFYMFILFNYKTCGKRRWGCTVFYPLKSSGHYMYRQFSIQQFYVLPAVYLCVLCGSGNKQRLFPDTASTD